MPRQVHIQLPLRHGPALERGVRRAGDEESGVGGPGELVDGLDVAAQDAEEAAGEAVPEPDALVEGGRGKHAAVGAELDVVHKLEKGKDS